MYFWDNVCISRYVYLKEKAGGGEKIDPKRPWQPLQEIKDVHGGAAFTILTSPYYIHSCIRKTLSVEKLSLLKNNILKI